MSTSVLEKPTEDRTQAQPDPLTHDEHYSIAHLEFALDDLWSSLRVTAGNIPSGTPEWYRDRIVKDAGKIEGIRTIAKSLLERPYR